MVSSASRTKNSGRIFRFGPFRLDEGERLLLRDGDPVQLTPKVYETLLLLVARSGHLIEKEDLMKAIWPDSFVEEVNLNRSISTLRRALGDDPNSPCYIETVPKRGYRFIAQVTVAASGEGQSAGQDHAGPDIIADQDTNEAESDPQIEGPSSETKVEKRPVHLLSRRAAVLMSLAVLLIATLIYFVTASKSTPLGGTAARPTAVSSLAVLPFKTLAATEQDQPLGIGITDVLITTLSNLKEINVRSTRTVLKYSESVEDPVAAGRALKVDAVLEGSVQRVDDRIRVTVRLMSVGEERPLWAAKFDEPAADILKVQDSIAERVARALTPSFNRSSQENLVKRYTENSEAYQLYLKGRYFWNKRMMADYRKAIECYEQAIGKDPRYALAWAGLADAYALLANASSDEERGEDYQRARGAALKSLEIDEGLSEAHTSLGWIKRTHEWDWPGAEKEFRRALELNPNSTVAHQWYAVLLTTLGRKEEAIAEINRAQELDPVSWVVHANAFGVFFRVRQFDQAIAQCQQALELDSTSVTVRGNLAMIYLEKGMSDEAIAEIQKAMPERNGTTLPGLLGRAYAQKGQREKALEIVEYLQQEAKKQSEALVYLAMVYSDLGEKDQAFECLRKAYEARDDRMVWIKLDPRFDGLRSDPRFGDLLRKMRLTE